MTTVQAIRGATTLDSDSPEQMLRRVPELLSAMYERNGLIDDDVISIMFTVTPDLHCMFPPTAARSALGMETVPMMGAVEMEVPGALCNCVRVMMHVSTPRDRRSLRHVYLNEARALRPDLEND